MSDSEPESSSDPEQSTLGRNGSADDDGVTVTLDTTAVLELLLLLLWRLQPRTLFGYLGEALHYLSLRSSPYAVRSSEGSLADGAHWLGSDVDLTGLSFAEKLDRLNSHPSASVRRQLAVEDSKTAGPALIRGATNKGKTLGTAVSAYLFGFKKGQGEQMSHAHYTFATSPHMVSLLPSVPYRRLIGIDLLSYYMPILPRFAAFAFPLASLDQAHESLHEMYLTRVPYVVPRSGVQVRPWAFKVINQDCLNAGGAAQQAFNFLRQAVSQSTYAQEHHITVEFSPFQPLAGDAELRHPARPAEILELKYNLLREININGEELLRIAQVKTDPKSRKRISVFNPSRSDNFVCFFGDRFKSVYWVPASNLPAKFWSGEIYIDVPRALFGQFRIDIEGQADWFSTAYEDIVIPHSQSKRPHHEVPATASAEDYAAGDYDTKEPRPTEYTKKKGRITGYPYWKIERWNRRCAHVGYGVYLPLGRQSSIANVVWIGIVWSVEDKVIYHATGRLPLSLHTGDINPKTPVMLIRAIGVRTNRLQHSGAFPANVAGYRLDRGPFPCLFYIDCETWTSRRNMRSGLLFPSELVDYEYLNEQYSGVAGKKVSSAREALRSHTSRDKAAEVIDKRTDLSLCLKVPYTELMVREGKEFDDAIRAFAEAQTQEKKRISWSKYSELYAEEQYIISFQQLLQALADRTIEQFIAVAEGRASSIDDDDDSSDDEDDDSEDEEEEYHPNFMGMDGTSDIGLDGTFDRPLGEVVEVDDDDPEDDPEDYEVEE